MNSIESLGVIGQVNVDFLKASNPKTSLERVYICPKT